MVFYVCSGCGAQWGIPGGGLTLVLDRRGGEAGRRLVQHRLELLRNRVLRLKM